MTKITNKLLYLITLIFLFNVMSQSAFSKKYVINGRVLSSNDKKALVGASVRIEGTALGGTTKRDGFFIITNISGGNFHLLVSYVGFETRKINVTLNNNTTVNDTLYLDIMLSETALQTKELVVSANKQLQAVQDVPISVSIISRQDILNRSVTKFEDILQYVPGIQMNNETISIRGSSGFSLGLGSRVALLVDGFPMLSGDNGDIKFDIFPPNEIERIEIVKGAGSALYGTGAIGGVVNIISKDPSITPALSFQLFSGIYTKPTYDQWVYRNNPASKSGINTTYSQTLGKFGFMLSGQFSRDESYRDYDDATAWNLLSKIKYDASDRTKINLLFNIIRDFSTDWVYWRSLESATKPPESTNKDIRIQSNKQMGAVEIKHIFSSEFFTALKLSYIATDFANTYELSHSDYRQSDAKSFNSELQLTNVLQQDVNLSYGLNFNYNTVKSSTYGNHYQTIAALYGQLEWLPIKSLITTVGVRIDNERTENIGSEIVLSPKFGLNYSLSEETYMRLSFGHGFRAATVAEKFASVNFQSFRVIPNPELKPEKSISSELGINHTIKQDNFTLILDAAAFVNFMNDLIEPTFDISLPNAPIKFQNITEARISGIEFEAKSLLFGFLGLKSSVTLLEPIDRTLNQVLKYRSKFLWYSSLSIPLYILEFQADYRYLTRVENIDNSLGLQIKDYDARVPIHVLDLRLLASLNKLLTIPLKIGINAKNMLNYYYTEVPGNLAPTRYIGLHLEGDFR